MVDYHGIFDVEIRRHYWKKRGNFVSCYWQPTFSSLLSQALRVALRSYLVRGLGLCPCWALCFLQPSVFGEALLFVGTVTGFLAVSWKSNLFIYIQVVTMEQTAAHWHAVAKLVSRPLNILNPTFVLFNITNKLISWPNLLNVWWQIMHFLNMSQTLDFFAIVHACKMFTNRLILHPEVGSQQRPEGSFRVLVNDTWVGQQLTGIWLLKTNCTIMLLKNLKIWLPMLVQLTSLVGLFLWCRMEILYELVFSVKMIETHTVCSTRDKCCAVLGSTALKEEQ